MVAYYYKAQILGWFRYSSDSTVESLHEIVGKPGDFPLSKILQHFSSAGLETEFTAANINKRNAWLLLLHLIHVANEGRGAFNVKHKRNEPQVDHIYPKSLLREEKFALDSSDIDHLGNFSFLEASENNRKSAANPATYYHALGNRVRRILLVEPYITDLSKLQRSRRAYIAFRDARLDYILKTARGLVEVEPARVARPVKKVAGSLKAPK